MKSLIHGYQTYQMPCNTCGEDRWPYLPEKPLSYTCMRCRSLPPGEIERRIQHGKKSLVHLQAWEAKGRPKGKPKKCPKGCRCLCHEV